jgi:ankyrin repeat protein
MIGNRDYSEHPLHQAAIAGDAARVSQLVLSGNDVNARTRRGETPLMAAAGRGRLEALEALLAAKPKLELKDKASAVGEGRQTALHCAVDIGHYRVARRLLEAGAQVDPVSQHGYTPLVQACYAGNLDVVRLLLEHGANPNGCDPRQTPLNGACTKSSVALLRSAFTSWSPCAKSFGNSSPAGRTRTGRVTPGNRPSTAHSIRP